MQAERNSFWIVSLSAFALGAAASAAVTWVNQKLSRRQEKLQTSKIAGTSHFDPTQERRGLGVLIKRLNHVALAVSDVGASLHFYTG